MKDEYVNIEVRKVSNGVIVLPAYNHSTDRCVAFGETLVFDSKEAFVKWASEFFPKGK